MRIVVGLGNPGTEYARTRHNAGFILVKKLAREQGVKFNRMKRAGYAAVKAPFPENVIFGLPKTYMNKSGLAVRALLDRFKTKPEALIIVYDDFDLDLGQIRIRKKGSAGSHKGVRSIIQEIRTSEFSRIRIGIGPPPTDEEAADFVLSPFTADERPLFEKSLIRAREALDMVIAGHVEEAMNKFNTRPDIHCGE